MNFSKYLLEKVWGEKKCNGSTSPESVSSLPGPSCPPSPAQPEVQLKGRLGVYSVPKNDAWDELECMNKFKEIKFARKEKPTKYIVSKTSTRFQTSRDIPSSRFEKFDIQITDLIDCDQPSNHSDRDTNRCQSNTSQNSRNTEYVQEHENVEVKPLWSEIFHPLTALEEFVEELKEEEESGEIPDEIYDPNLDTLGYLVSDVVTGTIRLASVTMSLVTGTLDLATAGLNCFKRRYVETLISKPVHVRSKLKKNLRRRAVPRNKPYIDRKPVLTDADMGFDVGMDADDEL